MNKNNGAKLGNFSRSTKTNSPKVDSAAISLPPIGNNFMYIETSSNNHGDDKIWEVMGIKFVSWERTDIFQLKNITFYYNSFSVLTNDSLKSIGRFRIQLLLEDITWITQYTIHT